MKTQMNRLNMSDSSGYKLLKIQLQATLEGSRASARVERENARSASIGMENIFFASLCRNIDAFRSLMAIGRPARTTWFTPKNF